MQGAIYPRKVQRNVKCEVKNCLPNSIQFQIYITTKLANIRLSLFYFVIFDSIEIYSTVPSMRPENDQSLMCIPFATIEAIGSKCSLQYIAMTTNNIEMPGITNAV